MYKVSLKIKEAAIFRNYPLSYIIDYCITGNTDNRPYSLLTRAWYNKDQIQDLSELLIKYDSKLWTKRIERDIVDLYTNDVDFYETVSSKFESVLQHRFEPDTEVIDLLDQPQVIVATKLPHNRYNYKVYLLPHKLAGNKEAKTKYVDWLKSQCPRITCTSAVQKWFIKTDWNWDRRYVLVEDEHTLLLMKLRNSEVVGRVYKYHITDK